MAKPMRSVYKLHGLTSDLGTPHVKVYTTKHAGRGAASSFHVYYTEQYNGYAVEKFTMFKDYSKADLDTFMPSKRVTDKVIEASHDKALELLPKHLAQIAAHYGVAQVTIEGK